MAVIKEKYCCAYAQNCKFRHRNCKNVSGAKTSHNIITPVQLDIDNFASKPTYTEREALVSDGDGKAPSRMQSDFGFNKMLISESDTLLVK